MRRFIMCVLPLCLASGCHSRQDNLYQVVQVQPSRWNYESSESYSMHIEGFLFNQTEGLKASWQSLLGFYQDYLEHYEQTVSNAHGEKERSLALALLNNAKEELEVLKSDWQGWSCLSISEVLLKHETPTKMMATCQYSKQPYDIVFTFYSEKAVPKKQVYELLRKLTKEFEQFTDEEWLELNRVHENFFDENGEMVTRYFDSWLHCCPR